MIPPNALPPWIWPPDRINQFVRSLLGRGRLRVQEWSEDECTIPLWWGPMVTVGPGDRILLFTTPFGLQAEQVLPAPDPEAKLQHDAHGITAYLRFS